MQPLLPFLQPSEFSLLPTLGPEGPLPLLPTWLDFFFLQYNIIPTIRKIHFILELFIFPSKFKGPRNYPKG